MFAPPTAASSWTAAHQYLYSLVWSSFLDLDFYTAARALRRFRPYSIAWVLDVLLHGVPGIAELRLSGSRRVFMPDEAIGLDSRVRLLALWTLTPSLFDRRMSLGSKGPRATATEQRDEQDRITRLREIFRGYFHERFDAEVATFRQSFASWPLLPPLLGGAVTAAVTAARRSATAHVSADVQQPYEQLRRFIWPRTWSVVGYWAGATYDSTRRYRSPLTMQLRLPGGRFKSSKLRELHGECTTTSGSFESRLDYDMTEPTRAEPPDRDAPARSKPTDDPNARVTPRKGIELIPAYSPERPHIASLRGYLSFAKIPGRPGWTRVVAERTARFESPNHDRFRVETLLFWLAVELLTFTRDDPDGDAHAV